MDGAAGTYTHPYIKNAFVCVCVCGSADDVCLGAPK